MDKRPDLNKAISIHDFSRFYWLKSELQEFCRTHDLSTVGGKIDIAKRIKRFLEDGTIESPVATTIKSKTSKVFVPQSVDDLYVDMLIGENIKCTQIHREFFISILGPRFHFSVAFQKFLKANPTKTFGDAIEFWHQEQLKKQDPGYKTEIGPQFEYNRFTRAYFADPANKGKTRKDAIAAWKIVRDAPGSNEYKPQR